MAEPGSDTEEATWRQRAISRGLGDAHSRAGDRAQKFVAAAWELIDERSSTEFTIHELIARSGDSIRGFYQSFDGKDELLLALLEDSIHEQLGDLLASVEQETDPLERLRVYTLRLYDWCEPSDTNTKLGSHKHLPVAEFAVHVASADPTQVEAAMAPLRALLLQLLDDAAAAGLIQGNRDRTAALLEQLVMYSWYRNRVVKDPARRISGEDIWEFCLHGFGT